MLATGPHFTAQMAEAMLKDLHLKHLRLSDKKGAHATQDAEFDTAMTMRASGLSANKFKDAIDATREVSANRIYCCSS